MGQAKSMPRISMRSMWTTGFVESGGITWKSLIQPLPWEAAMSRPSSTFTAVRLSPLKRPPKRARNGK
ncbi:MAG: hypothetical protein AAB328_03150 [candidate division NC10 bacterium]